MKHKRPLPVVCAPPHGNINTRRTMISYYSDPRPTLVASLPMTLTAPIGFQDTNTQELLAIIELMYLVAKADGFFSSDERLEFLRNTESLTENRIGSKELGQLIDRWEHEGVSNLEARLAKLSAALGDETARRIAYGFAVQIARADGQTLQSETTLLDKIAAAFKLDSLETEEIVDSVRMSSRPTHI